MKSPLYPTPQSGSAPSRHPLAQLPVRAGIGLKPEHFKQIITAWPAIGFFEIHAENYMVAGGPFHHYLSKIREHYPLSVHGIGLSIGGENPLSTTHLARLTALLERYEPEVFSEHLAWSSHNGVFINDLLPVPYNLKTLQTVCDHIDQVQTHLKRQILLENPATYLEFSTSDMDETEFISETLRRTGCGLLLDVNNVYISCSNHNRDPYAWLRAIPGERVSEIHLAGFTREQNATGTPLLIDSHNSAVDHAVLELYQYALKRSGPVATLIEWDNDVPALEILFAEATRAEEILFGALAKVMV